MIEAAQKRQLVDPTTGMIFEVPVSAIREFVPGANVAPIYRIGINLLNALCRCPKAFEYQYIQGVKHPWPAKVVASITFAEVVRYGYQLFLEDGGIQEPESLEAEANNVWVATASRMEVQYKDPNADDDEPYRTEREWIDLVGAMVMQYYKEVMSTGKYFAEAIAEPFLYQVPGTEYCIVGNLDIQARNTETDTRVLIEPKFGSRKKSEGEAASDKELSALAVNYFVQDKRRTRPVQLEFHQAVDRKKNPGIEIVPTERTMEDCGWFVQFIRSKIRDLETGNFSPNPDSWMCTKKACAYWDMCHSGGEKFFSFR